MRNRDEEMVNRRYRIELMLVMQMRQEIMILRMWKMQQGVFENKAASEKLGRN